VNRRKFLGRLGYSAVGAGAVAAFGLPKIAEKPEAIKWTMTEDGTHAFSSSSIIIDPVRQSHVQAQKLLNDISGARKPLHERT